MIFRTCTAELSQEKNSLSGRMCTAELSQEKSSLSGKLHIDCKVRELFTVGEEHREEKYGS